RRRHLDRKNHPAAGPHNMAAPLERLHAVSSAGDPCVDVGCEINDIETGRRKIEARERADAEVGSASDEQLACRRFCISNELWAYVDPGNLEVALREPECLAAGPATDIEERLSGTKISIGK